MIAAQVARTRQLVWPREHGAWGMLLVPLLTGAWIGIRAGGSGSHVLLFTVVTLALFFTRTPVESLLGTSPLKATRAERSAVIPYAFVFGLITSVLLALLFWDGNKLGLLALGGAVAVLFAIQVALRRFGRSTRMAAQIAGALALTSTAPGAYYAATGKFGAVAFGLWFANWIFAANQIHFVQLRLRASRCATWEDRYARGRGFVAGQLVMILALALAWAFGIVPTLVLLAFVPILIRGLIWFFSSQRPLTLHRLGMTELAHAVAFGALLIAGLR
ncbi:MAG TPA: YwiC-like family protein [Terriglobales bacterium]|jgi:hypothetical protein|nr:YwiC-like family protein [Terriglobales bacterium]